MTDVAGRVVAYEITHVIGQKTMVQLVFFAGASVDESS